jgi:pimeloyl-ACP methyl ester carboxylesterase
VTDQRTAGLLLHGAGTDGRSALRLLTSALPAGTEPLALPHGGDVADLVDAIDRAAGTVERSGLELVTVAGLSVGAHAVAAWAARRADASPLPELVLVMPAWTGAPDRIAGLTAASADEIEHDGVPAILARLVDEAAGDWVVDELVRSWAGADPAALAASLRTAAGGHAPTLEELATIDARTAVVALADDPLHPVAVAEAWARAIPGARLAIVPRDAPSTDRGALGRAARAALDA